LGKNKNYKVLFRINATDLIDSISFYLPEEITTTIDTLENVFSNIIFDNIIDIYPNLCKDILFIKIIKRSYKSKFWFNIINYSGKLFIMNHFK